MWVTPVTPLPATSVPDRLTLAYRLELAASAGAALARPMIAGAAKVAATAPVVSAIRLRRRALVPVNMKCLPYEMRRRTDRPDAGGLATAPTCQDCWARQASTSAVIRMCA